MLQKTIVGLAVFASLLVVPAATQAYQVTDAARYTLSDDALLYVLSYTHTVANYDAVYTSLPQLGNAVTSNGVVGMSYGYGDVEPAAYTSQAVVLSQTPAEDSTGNYIVSANTQAEFSLVVLFRSDSMGDVAPELQVTGLQAALQNTDGTAEGILAALPQQLSNLKVQ